MLWNDHSRDVREGTHAFLSPSQYSWLGYDRETLIARYRNRYATSIGTILHSFARDRIKYGIKVTRYTRSDILLELLRNGIPESCIDMEVIFENFKNYVNDAIGFQLTPEQALVYSENCFGWADAISFSEEKRLLRIHDLKTGLTPASMKQLEIYAALFCLEYKKRPGEIDIELAIYQTAVDEDGYYADINAVQAEPEAIAHHMDQIITLDKWLKRFKGEHHE